MADTRYFIFDTKGDKTSNYNDKDFTYYTWRSDRFNKVREGDKFIYRRPGRSSELNGGEFYFFGAGNIFEIKKNSNPNTPKELKAILNNCIIFEEYLKRRDLENFNWKFKSRKQDSWQGLFNQHGMTEITKEDYYNLLEVANASESSFDANKDIDITEYKEIQDQIKNKNYYVDDSYSRSKVRIGHQAFAEAVKTNYDYTCPITGIKESSFLRASHIIPWSKRKDTRLDPQNGICLYCDIDIAFDKGFISFNPDNLELVFTKKLTPGTLLYEKLEKYKGKKLVVNSKVAPKIEYLKWHYENFYLKIKKL